MKKMMLLLLTLVLGMMLAACNSQSATDGKKDPAKTEQKDEQTNKDDAVSDDDYDKEIEVTNPKFKEIIELLKENGYETGKTTAGDRQMFDAKDSTSVEINGEDQLPLNMFEFDPSSEKLAAAKKTGNAPVEFEGEKSELPVLVIGHFEFFLAEGHPDFKNVFKLLKDKFKGE
jgi:hypothetical protein